MPLTPVHRMGSTLADLRACPDRVQDTVGYALYMAQCGARHPSAQRLKGDLHGPTPKREIALIKTRLRQAKQHHAANVGTEA